MEAGAVACFAPKLRTCRFAYFFPRPFCLPGLCAQPSSRVRKLLGSDPSRFRNIERKRDSCHSENVTELFKINNGAYPQSMLRCTLLGAMFRSRGPPPRPWFLALRRSREMLADPALAGAAGPALNTLLISLHMFSKWANFGTCGLTVGDASKRHFTTRKAGT